MASNNPAIISCRQVSYAQGGVDILRGIDWEIERGRHWAVLGPNGCGKTTLLRIACGYLWPTEGEVLRLGESLIDLSELRRSIGWISGDLVGRIPTAETALETVVSGRYAQIGLRRLPEWGPRGEDFDDALEQLRQLDCESLAQKPFGVLSQGERQQVLIARARMASPLLMVLDEPCAGMDPGVRERFLEWLDHRIRQPDSPAVVLVTHHVEEIVPAIRQTLVLRDGRVHSSGETGEIITARMMEEVYQTRVSRIEKCAGRLWPIWGEE